MDSLIYKSRTYADSVRRIAKEIPADGGAVLITGAGGLIGSCLADVFLEANDSFGKDFIVYAMGRSRTRLIERFGSNSGIRFIEQDVSFPIQIGSLRYIIHAASNADPKSYALYPAETMVTNLLGAKNILDYTKEKETLPPCLTTSFAAYIAFYSNDVKGLNDKGLVCRRPKGNEYTVSDDRPVLEFFYTHRNDSEEDLAHAVMANTEMWGQDLTEVPGFEEAVVRILKQIRTEGALAAYRACLE